MNNKSEFKEFMAGAGEIFNKQITPIISKMYWKVLEPFTDEQCRKAFNLVIEKCKFFPKPAELIEFIVGSPKQIKQSQDDKALVIANEIIAHLNISGSRVFPKLDDKIAKYLMTKRWPYYEWASTVLESELKWWIKEFCEAYKSYSAREVPMEIAATEDVKRLVNLKSINFKKED